MPRHFAPSETGQGKFLLPRTAQQAMLGLNVDAAPSDYSEFQKPLEHFRAKTRHLTIHPLEKLLLWVVSMHLVFLPWAIGGMRPWGQWTSLGFAIVGFLISLIPRDYTVDHTGANSFRLIPWPRSTTDSSKATTSAGRPFGRIIRHDSGVASVLTEASFGNGFEVGIATRLRVRSKLNSGSS